MPYLDKPTFLQDIAPAPESRFPGGAFVCQETRSVGAQGRSQTGPEAASSASLGRLRDTYAGGCAGIAQKPRFVRDFEESIHEKKRQEFEAERRAERRAERFAMQRASAELTPEMRVRHCMWTPTGHEVGLVRRPGGSRFIGLQTCGSVWSCPCCSARISEVRRTELQTLIEWAGSKKYKVVMMTLTARHRRRGLSDLVDRLAKAKRRLQNRKPWQRLRGAELVGTVSVREATHGFEHGWHPHYHLLCVIDADSMDDAKATLEPLRAQWLDCLRKEGLTGTRDRAFHLQFGDAVAAYISKHGRDNDDRRAAQEARPRWGIAEEMTRARTKKGTGNSRSPWQILRDTMDTDDPESEALWREYSRTMRGRRQQVWSDGLKLACGVDEVDDEEAAEPEEFTDDEDEAVIDFTAHEWRLARLRRAELLTAAERGATHEELVAIIVGQDQGSAYRDPRRHQPRPGGLAAAALATVRAPPGKDGSFERGET